MNTIDIIKAQYEDKFGSALPEEHILYIQNVDDQRVQKLIDIVDSEEHLWRRFYEDYEKLNPFYLYTDEEADSILTLGSSYSLRYDTIDLWVLSHNSSNTEYKNIGGYIHAMLAAYVSTSLVRKLFAFSIVDMLYKTPMWISYFHNVEESKLPITQYLNEIAKHFEYSNLFGNEFYENKNILSFVKCNTVYNTDSEFIENCYCLLKNREFDKGYSFILSINYKEIKLYYKWKQDGNIKGMTLKLDTIIWGGDDDELKQILSYLISGLFTVIGKGISGDSILADDLGMLPPISFDRDITDIVYAGIYDFMRIDNILTDDLLKSCRDDYSHTNFWVNQLKENEEKLSKGFLSAISKMKGV